MEDSTYVYDDGSTITRDYGAGGSLTVSSTAATDNGILGYTQDQREQSKYGAFYPGDKPWYEQLALYGATRAIDSHFRSAETDKTAQPVTFAGQNGQTYAAGATRPDPMRGMGGVVLLAAAALGALLLLRK